MDFHDKFKLIIILLLASLCLIGLIDNCPDKGDEWKGVVSEKYLDVRNHSYETIRITNSHGIKQVYFTREASGFFDTVRVGDYVNKKANSFHVILNRDGVETTKKLNYNCD